MSPAGRAPRQGGTVRVGAAALCEIRHGRDGRDGTAPPLLIAHRGGAGLWPENTLLAFRSSLEKFRPDAFELDVHASADGRCVVIHDPTVDRTTNGTGAVSRLTLAELQSLDAGYRFSTDGGRTYPFRGKGARIPTIEEVLEATTGASLVVEVKTAAAQRPLFDAIQRFDASERVMAAGERRSFRTLFNEYTGPVSGCLEQLLPYWALHRARFGRFWCPRMDAVQIPETWSGRRLVTRRLVADLHAHGVPVHVWTVNDPDDMRRLLDWGVDGLITDRPDLLLEVLRERGERPPA